ncbi:MAG: hypothetical protein GEU79_00610 [Acidimicrobiia bacterium]|nr:hypothetical protein [Acidimicrobiia bacterium]
MRHRWLATMLGVIVAVAGGVIGWGLIGFGDETAELDGRAVSSTEQPIADTYANLPLTFVENRGQTDEQVRYLAQGARSGFYFTSDSLAMSLLQDGERGVNLFLDFVGANPDVDVDASQPALGKVNYLKGDDPATRQTALPTYREIVYDDLWRGIDLVVLDEGGVLKYEFRVQPGASVDDIRLAYRGADGLAVDDMGRLVVNTAYGSLQDAAPVSYQLRDGRKVPIDSRFSLDGDDESYGFAVGDHDLSRELVIDPGLSYATYLGGSFNQAPTAIAVDGSGNAYVTGYTQSTDFPTTPGAFDRSGSYRNELDAFVSKVNPTGTGLVYSTFLGGSDFEWGNDLAVDAEGNAYVTGRTQSSNFPVTGNAFQDSLSIPGDCPRCGIGQEDAFVTKLNPSGSDLVYSTYLGGTGFDDGMGIEVDESGRSFVAGQTGSSNFPTRSGSYDRTHNGVWDVFVTKFNASGSGLVYSTFLGGSDVEAPYAIDIDSTGNAVVVGSTASVGFPTTPGTIMPTHGSDRWDGYVTKLNPSGSGLVFSTFVGGSGDDSAGGVELDSSGNVYLLGSTASPEFPTTEGAFDTVFDGRGTYIAKLNPSASEFVYSTFFGLAGAWDMALEGDGSLWLAGASGRPDVFLTPDAWDSQVTGEGSDIYLAHLDPAGANLDYATFLGRSGSDWATSVALDADGNVYITGNTRSEEFPTTEGAFDDTFGGNQLIGGEDGFVARFEVGSDAPLPPPPPPPIPGGTTLLSPAEGAIVVPPATFDWDDVAGAASYEFQIDEGSWFGLPLIVSEEVAVSEFAVNDLPDGNWTWFWRVRALNSEGTPGPWSEVRSFDKRDTPPATTTTTTPPTTTTAPPTSTTPPTTTTVPSTTTTTTAPTTTTTTPPTTTTTTTTTTLPPSEPLPAPEQISPRDDDEFEPGSTITFDWGNVAGAVSYTIQIDDDDDFPSPHTVEETVVGSEFTKSGLSEERFWWRVRANDSNGNPGEWSPDRRFELED